MVTGSYDEYVRFWDIRKIEKSLCRKSVGGGVSYRFVCVMSVFELGLPFFRFGV